LPVAPVDERAVEGVVEILRQTMPLQVAGDDLLRRIAGAGRHASYDERAVLYEVDDDADDLYIIVSGQVRHTLGPGAHALQPTQILKKGDVFGWAALLEKTPRRLARAVCTEPTEIVRIAGDELLRVLARDPDIGDVVMSRFATMIAREFTVPDLADQLRRIHRKMRAPRGSSATLPGCRP